MTSPERVLTRTPPSAFTSLGLSPPALEAIARLGFSTPTPIQQQAIPPALAGHDVIGCAATGTGKTAAFLLPLIDRLAGKRGTRALVLAPTRELVLQILEQARELGQARGFRGVGVIGGAAMGPQVRDLRLGVELVVATPGRLCDHLNRGNVKLDQVEVLVLDEADRMLDMGFRTQLDHILARVPRTRQTMLFSATIGGEVGAYAKRHLNSPIKVEVGKSGTVAQKATQSVFHVHEADKPALLLSLLAKGEETTLVFTRTQHRADKLAKILARAGVNVARIHGGRSQAQRKHALDGFRAGDYRVLVATDIAARGIDVVGIGHVVNFDLSHAPEDHVHRVGRTARAELSGHASTLASPPETKLLRDIERFTRIQIARSELPTDLAHWRAEIEKGNAEAQSKAGSRAPHPRSQGRSSQGGSSSRSQHGGSSSRSHRGGPASRPQRGDFAPRSHRSESAPRSHRGDSAPRSHRGDFAPRAPHGNSAPRAPHGGSAPRAPHSSPPPRAPHANASEGSQGSHDGDRAPRAHPASGPRFRGHSPSSPPKSRGFSSRPDRNAHRKRGHA